MRAQGSVCVRPGAGLGPPGRGRRAWAPSAPSSHREQAHAGGFLWRRAHRPVAGGLTARLLRWLPGVLRVRGELGGQGRAESGQGNDRPSGESTGAPRGGPEQALCAAGRNAAGVGRVTSHAAQLSHAREPSCGAWAVDTDQLGEGARQSVRHEVGGATPTHQRRPRVEMVQLFASLPVFPQGRTAARGVGHGEPQHVAKQYVCVCAWEGVCA